MSLVTSWERCPGSALRAYQKVSSICTMRAYSFVVVYSEERRKAKMLRKERARRKKKKFVSGKCTKKVRRALWPLLYAAAAAVCGGNKRTLSTYVTGPGKKQSIFNFRLLRATAH